MALRARVVRIAVTGGIALTVAGLAAGQDYPNKPIRIVTVAAGGGSDFSARQIANGISGPLGQPVVVDNRASTQIAAEVVAKSPPDGYTLYVGAGAVWVLPLLQKVPYDMSEFAPLSLLERSENLVVVHPSVPVSSVSELIALAKAKPGALNYASAGPGGNSHLSSELFLSMANINIVHVPYKGVAAAIPAVLTNEVQLLINDAGLLAPHAKAGKLKAIAVTSPQPSPNYPGLPTVAQTLPGYESGGMTGILAPAKTPAVIITRLNREIVRVYRNPEVMEKIANFNVGVNTVGSSPEEFATVMKEDIARMGKVIKERNIKMN